MSGAMIAVVEFSPVKNCFISLPASWAKDLSQVQFPTFQLEWGESLKAFVSWAGDITRHNDARDTEVIQINGLYGNKLGLVHGQEVLVQAVPSVLPCSQASVEPASFDDWEILELNASYVETNLLSQVRVIWPNQILPVWIGKKICIFINISQIEPTEKCTRLEPYTELAIIPKTRTNTTNTIPSNPQTPTVSSTVRGDTLDQTPIDFNTKHAGGSSRVPANAETPSSLASIGESLTSGYVSDFGSTANIPLCRSHVDDTLENVDVDEDNYVKDNELDSSLPWAYRLWTYLKSFVSIEDSGECAIEQGKLSLDKERQKAIAKELLKDCNIVARIHTLVDSYEHIEPSKNASSSKKIGDDEINKNSYSHLMQPTTVYLSSDAEGALIDLPMDPSKPKNFSSHEDYVSFYAIITKLKSPKERQEEMRQRQDSNSTKNSKTFGEIRTKVDDILIDDAIKHTQKSTKWNKINIEYSAVRVVLNSQDIQTRQRSQYSMLLVFDDASPWTLQISDLLRRQLKLELTAKVLIQPITEAPSLIQSMALCPLYRLQREITPAEIECAFQQWLTTVSCMIWPIPVCAGSSLLKFPVSGSDGEQEEFVLTINTEHDNMEKNQQRYFLLHPFIAKKVKFGVFKDAFCDASSSIPPRTTRQIDHVVAGFRLRDLGGVTELGQSGLNHIKTSLGIRPLSKLICSGLPGLMQGGMIITGPKGSGKSTLAMAVCREVMTWPQLVYVSVLECKPLKGKRVESVRRRFEEAFNEAAWRQPSLILLDDLDQLTGSPLGPEQEISPDALYSSRIAEVLKDLMSAEIRQGTRLCVIATCLTRTSLHQGLISSRGTHFFQHWIDIKPLDLRKREEMLISMIQSKMEVDLRSLDDLDLHCLASKCEGYVARDLMTVIERAIHAACSREMINGTYNTNQVSSEENGITLIDEDFECALQNYTPATLRDVPLHNAGDLSWKNVGGLTEVKKVLLETLLWPAKYPQLFKNCPLRLRSGLLLYGPPGTGKTLLGGAVAKECGLNFISIKGPELLSKYIGASEQSVRDLFRRAQSAKPCILFFDEFDALAPRRGHDSTGVTDRVVNQLLTQLDGVEGLDGVYVIAATSRPDLIDPALLRPGRLDKCLNCPIPDKSDQLDILHALSLNMTLDDDVNFDNIIEHCEFFTGADLKALLYNAQLDAIHSQMTPLPKPLSSDRLSPLHMKTCRSMEADEWKLTFLDSVSFDDANPLNIENRTTNNKSQPRKTSTSNDTDNELNPVVENSSSDSDSASFVRLSQSEEEYNSNNGKATPPGKHAPSLRDFAALKFERSPPLFEVADLETLGSMEDNAFYDLPSLYQERRQEQKLIYMPTLRDGIVDVSTETRERIANQVELIRKNHQDKLSGYSGLNKKDGSEAHESHAVKICQSNLLRAVNSMKPSVSAKERRRYQQIYDSFVNSRGGNFTGHDESSGKRATLA